MFPARKFASGVRTPRFFLLYSCTMAMADDFFLLGIVLGWLLNTAELGLGLLLLFTTEKYLPAVYTLIFGIGLVQVGYVAPLWRVLRRRGKYRSAKGLLYAALITLMLNVAVNYRFFGAHILPFWGK
jgi:hypothetical protein